MTTFLVTSGQTLSGVTLASGDTEAVLFGGTATSTIINGGFQDDAGTATNTTINGGYQFVESGGTASNTTVYSGAEQLVMSGGTAAGTTINSGGIEIIESRGTATGAIINGGQQYVNSGGVASNTTINGGLQIVQVGGTARNTTVYGGEELVMSGATASNAIINGGFQDDAGAAIGTTINNSGIEIVESGATATGTTVNGGEQLVNAGGIARNTVINGGTEYVFAGGTANGVTFGGHTGVLQLEQPGSLTGVISGWQTGDAIDFNGTVTGAVINGSTLQVTLSGGQSFSYQLAGQQSGTVIRIDYPGNGSVLRLVAKSPPLVTAALAHDTGTSATDKITADPALIGAGDPNATVHFTIDGTPNAATVTADAAGAWRYTPAGLADGVHTIVASETDAAGQTGISSLTFRLDTDTALAPSLVVGGGGTPTLNAAASHNVSFVLAGLDDETGTAIFSDGLNSIAVAVSGNGSYAVDLSTLNDGPISSRLTLGDPAGNNFSASGNQVNLDTDKGVMPRLLVNGGQPVIGVVHGSAVAFTVASRMRPGRQHSATAPIPSSSRSTAMALSRQTSAPLIPLPSARR